MESKARLNFEVIKIQPPEGCNLIIGITHFIKSVEDIYESIVNTVPGARFGLAFAEASGPCLIRHEGTDEELRKLASETLLKIGAGHTFLVFLRGFYPINIMQRLKDVPEVISLLAATANPVDVIVAETEQGRGIISVVDGYRSKGIEDEKHIKERRELLRKIGYKF